MKSVLLSVIIIAAAIVPSHAAEVDTIETSDVPPELAEAIEVKKVSEFKIIPIVDITALGTYSKIEDGGSIGGASVTGSIAPVMRIDERNYVIPLYYGSYDRERQVVVEEEGGRVYNEIMDHNGTLEYKHLIDDKTVLKLDGLVRAHYVKESGYSWGDGLYDYTDLGTGASVEYFFEKTKSVKNSISLGGEYYHREYPNYVSLIALASTTAPETNEKDYNGIRPSLRYKYMTEAISAGLFYSPLYKHYDDKKIIDPNGVLMSDKRHDWFHYINGELSYLVNNTPFVLGLGLTGIMVDSNQNYYDSRGTVTLADDVFTDDYYDFKSLSVNPKLTYIHRLKDKKSPATLTVGYAYTRRDYDDRKAQNADSSYTADTQLDRIDTVHVQGVYPLTDNISLLAVGNYTDADSNMEYETYYRYDYTTYFAGAGIRIRY